MDFRTYFDSLSSHEQSTLLAGRCKKLSAGGRAKQLCGLLTNFDFLTEKVSRFGIQSAIEDYDELSEQNILDSPEYNVETATALRLIQKALQQSENIIEEDNTQLPGQLLARLLPLNNLLLQKLLQGEGNVKGAKECKLYPWLDPLTVSISSSSQPLQKTITTNHDGNINAIAISEDEQWALSAHKSQLKVWNLLTRENKYTLEVGQDEICNNISAVALSWDGRWAAVGLYGYTEGKNLKSKIYLWDLEEGKLLNSFSADRLIISALVISQSGQHIVVVYEKINHHKGNDPQVWILDKEHRRVLTSVTLSHVIFNHQNKCVAVAANPNGQWVVTASYKFILLWNVFQKRLERAINLPFKETIKTLALSSKGTITAVFDNGVIRCWDFESELSLESIGSNNDGNLSIVQSPQKRWYFDSLYCDGDFLGLDMLVQFIHSSTLVFNLIFRCIHYRYPKKLITWILFLSQETVVKIFYFITKVFDFINGNFSETINFDEYRTSQEDLEDLWESFQIYSSSNPLETNILNLKGLNLPESLTSTGRIGLIKTKTGDIQVLDLTTARCVPNNEKGQRSTYSEIRSLDEPWEKAIAVSLDGRYVFSLAGEETLQMWDITGTKPPSLLKRKKVSSLWQRLKTFYHAAIKNRSEETSLPLHSLLFHEDIIIKNIDFVAKSLSGRWLFLISKNTFDVRDLALKDSDGLLSCWHLKDVSSNGHWALWQSTTKTFRLTNLKTGKTLGFLHDYYGTLISTSFWVSQIDNHWKEDNWKFKEEVIDDAAINAEGINISADGKTVLFCDSGLFEPWLWEPFQHLTQWNVERSRVHSVLPAYQQSKFSSPESLPQPTWILSITAFVSSSDGKKAFFGLKNGELKFCDLITNQVICSFKGHKMSVTSVNFSQDDQWAVSCSLDRTLKVWILPSCKQVTSFTLNNSLYISKITLTLDGRLLIVSSDLAKHVHVLHLKLPDTYVSAFQEQKSELAKSDQQADSAQEELPLIPQENWQSTFGIPLPLLRLKNLPDSLNSEIAIDYTHLRELLELGKWQEASTETKRLLLSGLNHENSSEQILLKSIKNFPTIDLLTLDRLWLKYSNGRYGFSLQMRIWDKCSHTNFSFLFHRIIGQHLLDKLIPCELIKDRRGHFPYPIFKEHFIYTLIRHYSPYLQTLFNRLAEDSGYTFTNNPISQSFEDTLHNTKLTSKTPIVSSNSQIDSSFYKQLHDLLAAKQWEDANRKTIQKLLSQLFDPQELQIIDDLWLKYSDQRFGLSIQKRIWEEVERDIEGFCRCVGWSKLHNNTNTVQPIIYNLSAPEGHLPALDVAINSKTNLDRFLKFQSIVFSHLNTYFTSTIPYPIQLKSLPRSTDYSGVQIKDLISRTIHFTVEVRGVGILDLRLFQNEQCIFSKQWIYKKDKIHSPWISIDLPYDSGKWKGNLMGSLILKSISGEIINSPFVTIKVISSLKEYDEIENYNQFSKKSKLRQRLQLQKLILGEYHSEVQRTLNKLEQECKQTGCYTEAKFFKYQEREIWKKTKKIIVGNESSAIILFLKPDEIVL